VRIAAGVYLGRSMAALDDATVADPRTRAALAFFPAARQELRRRGLLAALPEVLLDPGLRLPLASAYALATPWPTVAADRRRWTSEPAIADAIALALAWRALGGDQPGAAEAAVLVEGLEPRLASFWLAWAIRGRADLAWLSAPDPRDLRAATLAAAGGADRDVLAREVDDALWRAGGHPGQIWHLAWTELVRDALLAGSDHVSARLQLDERPPLPRGIEASDDKFFLVADDLLRFLTERGPGPPPELRLR
jgi:hypothetical protein